MPTLGSLPRGSQTAPLLVGGLLVVGSIAVAIVTRGAGRERAPAASSWLDPAYRRPAPYLRDPPRRPVYTPPPRYAPPPQYPGAGFGGPYDDDDDDLGGYDPGGYDLGGYDGD